MGLSPKLQVVLGSQFVRSFHGLYLLSLRCTTFMVNWLEGVNMGHCDSVLNSCRKLDLFKLVLLPC